MCVIEDYSSSFQDLVKSHLMFTVREEVEVLKERIEELLRRINQLEIENNFLRANVAPEVLVALNNGAALKQEEGPNNNTPVSGNAAGPTN